MAHATLVGLDVDAGRIFLKALDEAGLKIDVALWAVLVDYDDPRLVLAGKQLDQVDPMKAIQAVNSAYRTSGKALLFKPTYVIYRMKEPFIQDLRRTFGKTASVDGVRLSGQFFGGRYLEDAYVYRIK